MHADRVNRIALIVLGLLVLAAGAAGMTASVGGFGQAFSHRTLFDNRCKRLHRPARRGYGTPQPASA